jgi:hypothetical protein
MGCKRACSISSKPFVFKSVKIVRLFGQFVGVLFYRHDFSVTMPRGTDLFFAIRASRERKIANFKVDNSGNVTKSPVTKAYSRPVGVMSLCRAGYGAGTRTQPVPQTSGVFPAPFRNLIKSQRFSADGQ